jgi:membrane protein DedA with SNARE-associated domain
MSDFMKAKIIGFIIMLFIFYLFGCFISTSFNIKDWDILTRVNIVFFGFISAAFIAAVLEEE